MVCGAGYRLHAGCCHWGAGGGANWGAALASCAQGSQTVPRGMVTGVRTGPHGAAGRGGIGFDLKFDAELYIAIGRLRGTGKAE